MKQCAIMVSAFILFAKIKLFTLNPRSTDVFPWLTVNIIFKKKFNSFETRIETRIFLKTRILKVEDIKSTSSFVKIMKFYTIFFTSLFTKSQNWLVTLSHFEAVILFSTKKLRSFLIFRFELSNSFITKLAGLKKDQYLTITEPKGIFANSLDNKPLVQYLDPLKIKSATASSLYQTQYLYFCR